MRASPGSCSITWIVQNVGDGVGDSPMYTAGLPSAVLACTILAGLRMSNTCMPPLPTGLSRPGAQVEPGGMPPPPRSSVTNMYLPSGVGSDSLLTATSTSARTCVLVLQLV